MGYKMIESPETLDTDGGFSLVEVTITYLDDDEKPIGKVEKRYEICSPSGVPRVLKVSTPTAAQDEFDNEMAIIKPVPVAGAGRVGAIESDQIPSIGTDEIEERGENDTPQTPASSEEKPKSGSGLGPKPGGRK